MRSEIAKKILSETSEEDKEKVREYANNIINKSKMKHYYLINNKIMNGGEMPKEENFKKWLYNTFDAYLYAWHSSLQPCEITDIELDKVSESLCVKYTVPNINHIEEPIEVTDIVNDNDGVITFMEVNGRLCKKCYNPHRLIDEDYGSDRAILRLCVKCYNQPKVEANSFLNNALQWCLNYINKQKDSDEKTALIKELNKLNDLPKSESNESLRNQFESEIKSKNSIDYIFESKNENYIKWLESRITKSEANYALEWNWEQKAIRQNNQMISILNSMQNQFTQNETLVKMVKQAIDDYNNFKPKI